MSNRFVGTVIGKSQKQISSYEEYEKYEKNENNENNETLKSKEDYTVPRSSIENKETNVNENKIKEQKKKKRNHKININYFKALDDVISDSYEKQKAAYEITRAVSQLFETRGHNIPFDETRFERAAQNIATCQMMREMSWLFGMSPEHTDRIVDHTIDRLFGDPKRTFTPTVSNHGQNPYKKKEND